MKRNAFYGSILCLLSTILLAQQTDVPLTNWTVPPYRSSGITTMVDQTPPRAFIGLPVCRLLDTRPPTNNPLDGDGIYAANEIRTYVLAGRCGIPLGVEAVSLNITVTNTGNNPFGHVKIWPFSQAEPNVSTLNWATGGVTESNAAIVASPAGAISVKTGNAGADVIMDVNGYFSDTLGSPSNGFELVNDSPSPTIRATNQSTSCDLGCALWAQAESGHVIFSDHTGDASQGTGVFGRSVSTHLASLGVEGVGLYKGVRGVAGNYLDAAGVVGQIAYTTFANYALDEAGVRGQNTAPFGIGVLGISRGIGVGGHLVDTSGNYVAEGRLGTKYGIDPDASPPWAVFGQGNIGASGTKYFLDPHPTDPKKVIGYIALEGPEAGTYFRGRARFQRGLATIAVPEDFQLVTDSEGLTVQVTPIGEMASFAVVKMGLDEIVVKASRDVEFSYLVQGVRATWARRPPIFEDGMFIPQRPESRMPQWLTPEQQRRLVQNGTYRPDGTVNAETARRMGWERAWEQRSRPAPQPAEP